MKHILYLKQARFAILFTYNKYPENFICHVENAIRIDYYTTYLKTPYFNVIQTTST